MSSSDREDRSDRDTHSDREAYFERDARPPTLAVVTSLVAAAVAALSITLVAPVAGGVVGAAALLVAAGSLRRSTRLLAWGAGVGVAGIALAGYLDGAVEALLVAGVALAFAWDVADHGISLGEHVGREARARRNVVVHAGSTLLVGGLTVGVVYGVWVAAGGGQPVAALALLLFGGVALASALR